MSRYVRKAVGYQVRVKHEELMVEDDTDDEEGSEWDLFALPAATAPRAQGARCGKSARV